MTGSEGGWWWPSPATHEQICSLAWSMGQAGPRSTNEIAERLFVSRATVRSHVGAIVRKLDAPDRDAALAAVFAS